jgi:hypothetical protein
MIDANYTLTNLNGTLDEARNAIIIATGTNTAVRDIIAPLVPKIYTVYNNTTGGYAIRIKGSTGTAVTIPNGMIAPVYCDGTNYQTLQNGVASNFVVSGNFGVTGTAAFDSTVAATGAISSSAGISGTTGTFSAGVSGTTGTFSGIVTGSSFTGAGTGLTGTGTSFTAGASQQITNSGGWSVTPNGTKLYFNYNGTNVGSLDSSGNFIALGNVSAYGTP